MFLIKNKIIVDCIDGLNGHINRVKPREEINDDTRPIVEDLDTNLNKWFYIIKSEKMLKIKQGNIQLFPCFIIK